MIPAVYPKIVHTANGSEYVLIFGHAYLCTCVWAHLWCPHHWCAHTLTAHSLFVLSPGLTSELGVWLIWLCSQAFLELGETAKPERLSQGSPWLEGISLTHANTDKSYIYTLLSFLLFMSFYLLYSFFILQILSPPFTPSPMLTL